ncbi:hypothetical protein PTKIN_Ptkin01aG0341400 [Pterospermum kingtungense]
MKRVSIRFVSLACLEASATAQSASGHIAYWTDYNVTNNNWDFNAAFVSCAAALGDGAANMDGLAIVVQLVLTHYTKGAYLQQNFAMERKL